MSVQQPITDKKNNSNKIKNIDIHTLKKQQQKIPFISKQTKKNNFFKIHFPNKQQTARVQYQMSADFQPDTSK